MEELTKVWEQDLCGGVASDPENTAFFIFYVFMYLFIHSFFERYFFYTCVFGNSPNTIVDFVYNVLEISCFPLEQHFLISLLMRIFLLKLKPSVYINKRLAV